MRNQVARRWTVAIAAMVGACTAEGGDQQDAGSEPGVQAAVIVSPANGATVTGPDVQVDLAVENITLAAAGTNEPGTGHLHLFINHDLTPVDEVIPAGDGIVHLGKPQSGYLLEGAEPGEHTIIAVLGDWAHVRIAEARTDTIRIVVQ